MNRPVQVRESRILLVIIVICTALFIPMLILSTLSGIRKQDIDTLLICIPVFGSFTLLGLLLIINFLRRKLLLYGDHLSYTPPYGKTRSFTYDQISHVRPRGNQYILYSHEGKRLAVIENNMAGFQEAFCLLAEKQVKILPPPLSTLTEKNRNRKGRLTLTDKDAYIRFRWSPEIIKKQKRITRILRIALVILCFLAIGLPTEWMIIVYILIPLFNYGLFLILYPKMVLERGKDCDEYHMPFPVWSSVLSLLFPLISLQTVNAEKGKWIPMSVICLFTLLIPYLLTLRLRRIKEYLLTVLFTALLLAFLSFALFLPVNYAVSGRPVHETVTVLEKEKYRGSRTTNYYVTVIWQGTRQKMSVSGSLYESVSEGNSVRICLRESIFGVKLWSVHE